jgi:uncharacterized protein YjiS (DUF1127 family)
MAKALQLDEYQAHAALERSSALREQRSAGWKGLLTSAGKWRKAIGARRRERRAEHELAQLDDRMLRDIGIDRSEIRRAVRFGRQMF